jgi:peptide/nickel transport system permease protein
MNNPATPAAIAWKKFRKNRIALVGMAFLAATYLMAIFAGFFSPYSPTADEFREDFFHPPTPFYFHDETGRFSIRPFVARTHLIDRNRLIYSAGTPLYLIYAKPEANLSPYIPDTIESEMAVLTVKNENGKILGRVFNLTETGNASGKFFAIIAVDPISARQSKQLVVQSDSGETGDLKGPRNERFQIVDENGKETGRYNPKIEQYPVRFFVRGSSYGILWIFRSNLHLFGVDAPGRIFLLGTDQSGRDIFSRALFGAQISLSIGLIGVLLTTILGLLVGGVAGYYGGTLDRTLMRFAEVVMSIPALYLILTLRNIVPDRMQDSYDRLQHLTAETFAWQNNPAVFGLIVGILLLSLSYYLYRNPRSRGAWLFAVVCVAAIVFGKWIGYSSLRLLQMVIPGSTRLTSEWTYLFMIVILSSVGWAAMSRVIRGMVLSIREQEYVVAARALGGSDFRILTRHILPNTMGYVIVRATLLIPAYILGEVALSFLGVGVQEPSPSWGNMLSTAQNLRVLQQFTWTLAPGAFLFFTVLAFNFLGDGLRDALDPKL